MPINFPSAPATNDTYTYNNRTWIYNGTGWVADNTTSALHLATPTSAGTILGQTDSTSPNNVFLGYQAGSAEAGSNKLYIANSNTTTPLIYGDFALSLLKINGNISATSNMYAGADAYTQTNVATNPIIIAKDSGADYVQVAAINSASTGSADFAAYGDDGTDTAGFVDMGFTSSAYNDANYSITGKNDGYVLVQGKDAVGRTGNLVLATGTRGTYLTSDIVFTTGGFNTATNTTAEKMRLVAGTNLTDSYLWIKSTKTSSSTSTGSLVVAGGVGISGAVYSGGNNSATAFIPTSSSVPTNGLFYPVTNSVGFSTNSVEGLRIDSSGNVQVITGASRTSGNLVFGDGATTAYSTISGIYSSSTSGYLVFKTLIAGSSAERMRIDTSGNLGIGGTSTGSKLYVTGTIESTSGGIKFPDGTTQTSAASGGDLQYLTTVYR